MTAASSEKCVEDKGWVVDSGATANMLHPRLVLGVRNVMETFRLLISPTSFITAAGRTKLPATGYGNVNSVVKNATDKKVPMTLKSMLVLLLWGAVCSPPPQQIGQRLVAYFVVKVLTSLCPGK